MTFLDATISIWDWSSFDWSNKVDTIWKTAMCPEKIDGHLEKYIKTVLSWVVMSRIVIAHLYTLTYIANLYSIITWSRAKLLLPWLAMSAFKNFVLELIVLIVMTLLYIQGNFSGFLFITAIFDKIITIAIAAHNWNIINALYVKLNEKDERNVKNKKRLATSSAPFNIMIGMKMQHSDLDEIIRKRRKILSLPNLNYPRVQYILDPDNEQNLNESKSLTMLSSVDSQQFESRCHLITDDLNFPAAGNVLKIQDLTDSDANKNQPEHEYDHMDSEDSVSEVICIVTNENDEVNSKTSTCVCIPDTSENNISTSLKESFNGHSQRMEECCDVDEIENYSEWSRQWILENMLKTQKNIKIEETETEYDFRTSYDDKFSQWSSDEKLRNKKNDKMKKMDDKNCQWSPEDDIKNDVNETSTILQLVCVPILNHIIEIAFLVLESNFRIENKVKNNIMAKVLSSVQTQTNTDNTHKTNVTQTFPHYLLSKQYNLHDIQMLVDSFTKKNMFKSTLDREKKELEALRAYNALTLWKYKEEIDKMCSNRMKPSISDKYKRNTLKPTTNNFKNRNSNEALDDSQIGCVLDKSKANVNIPGLLLKNRLHKQLELDKIERDTLKADKESHFNQNLSISTSRKNLKSNKIINLKKKICDIDWTFYPCYSDNFDYINKQETINIATEESLAEIIDDYDTVSILRSAFSFNTSDNVRGFYLGPGSSDLYSISEQIPNVFHEIIKTARFKITNFDFLNYPLTQEEDFGEAYFQNWRTTDICNNKLFNNDTKETTNIIHCQDLEIIESSSDPVINNKNNYSHTKDEKSFHYFDDDDLSDLSFSAGDYFQANIEKSDSLSNFSNQSNMSEFEHDIFE